MTTPEQQAREMLGRMKVEHADYYSAGDLIELANLIAERDALKAELEAIKQGAGEPVAWALWLPNEAKPRQLHTTLNASMSAKIRWSPSYADSLHIPLYPPCVPLTDERASDLGREMVKGGKSAEWLVREVERAHNIKGAKG